MVIPFCDIKKDYLEQKEQIDENIQNVLNKSNYIMGNEVGDLETKLANYVSVDHCVAVSNGTDALKVALLALDVGPGDEVITVPFTWISSAEVINLVGAKPVFVDIDLDTYNLDPNKLEPAITSNTKAIIAVSIFGQVADFTQINKIAKKHNIPVIEDAAQSFGAEQKNKKSCSLTDIATTSFFPSKPFGGYGDGGAIFTNNEKWATKMKAIRTHGANVRHNHWCIGMNARLDTIQAAILLAKFENIDKVMKNRTDMGNLYTQLINENKINVKTPVLLPENKSVYAQYTLLVENRDELAPKLKEQGVPTAIYYPKCLHEQPVYSYLGYKLEDFPNSVKASREVLSLPMHGWLTEEEVRKVVDVLKTVL
jgi:UDP-2-acetamido-2-deoxy-ribo-hexuluronate aminotransferase